MLKVEQLACRRGARLIFRDIGFALAAGGLLRVTGANGSGKSSLLRVLAGLLPAAEGTLTWHGEPISTDPDAHRERLHYIGHLDAVKPELTGRETLDYWQALHGLSGMHDPFGLGNLLDKPARILSAGQRRRLALTRLTMGDAPLWLLDEPSASLDAAGMKTLTDMIAMHRAKGGMVIAAMHDALDALDAQTLQMPERA